MNAITNVEAARPASATDTALLIDQVAVAPIRFEAMGRAWAFHLIVKVPAL